MSSDPVAHLPHTGPARFVTRALETSAEHAVVEVRVPVGSAYRSAREGGAAGERVPAFLCIEFGAQAAAVLVGARAQLTERPPPGMLVSVRDAEFARAFLDADAAYRVTVEARQAAAPLLIFAFEVADVAGHEVARGELTLHVELPS